MTTIEPERKDITGEHGLDDWPGAFLQLTTHDHNLLASARGERNTIRTWVTGDDIQRLAAFNISTHGRYEPEVDSARLLALIATALSSAQP